MSQWHLQAATCPSSLHLLTPLKRLHVRAATSCPCIPTSRQPPALYWSPSSQNTAGQDTTFLFSGSVPWSDSQPPWQCSCVMGQDAPSWKCQVLALTKSKAGTSMKTSHTISVTHDTLLPPPWPKKKNQQTLGFVLKDATAFRAEAILALVNI